jgi:hypothetical protein
MDLSMTGWWIRILAGVTYNKMYALTTVNQEDKSYYLIPYIIRIIVTEYDATPLPPSYIFPPTDKHPHKHRPCPGNS